MTASVNFPLRVIPANYFTLERFAKLQKSSINELINNAIVDYIASNERAKKKVINFLAKEEKEREE